jgi:hypothetical protein
MSIMSSLHSCGPLAYSDNECAKQLLYALDDHIWGIKITALEESADFATLDAEKLFSKLKPHRLSHKGHPNHDASLPSKALITSARVGGHDANPMLSVKTHRGAVSQQHEEPGSPRCRRWSPVTSEL